MSRFATAAEALVHWANSRGDQPAYIFYNDRGGSSQLTWQRLHELSGRWAAVLSAGGAKRGQVVVNTLLDSPERLVTEVATMMSGAASLDGCSKLDNAADFLRVLKLTKASAIIVDPDINEGPWSIIKTHVTMGGEDTVTSPELPHLNRVYMVRRYAGKEEDNFLENLSKSKEMHQVNNLNPEDACAIFHSCLKDNISTRRKLIVHSHENIARVASSMPIWHNSEGKVDINFTPMGDICGTPFIPIFSGITRVSFDNRFSDFPDNLPEFLWKTSMQESCNFGVINLDILQPLSGLMSSSLSRKESSNRKQTWKKDYMMDGILLIGIPLRRETVELACKLRVKNVYTGYGCADFGLASVHSIDLTSFRSFDTGPLLSGVEVKIVWREASGKELEMPAGSRGEILVKTPTMMKEYLNDPAATAAALTPDGFFRTGHIGSIDKNGHLLFEGKGCSAILRGLHIIYPDWLEDRLKAHPGVQDVVIVGVPYPEVHEELCVCLIMDAHVSVKDIQELVENEIITDDNDPLSPRPLHYIKLDSFGTRKSALPKRAFAKEFAAQLLKCII